MQQAERSPLISSSEEESRPFRSSLSLCIAFGQNLIILLAYFSVIATLPISLLACFRLYEDNYAVKVTRFGKPVKPWTCLLHLFDVYFVLPYIDCVQKIQLIQDAQLQLGPQSCILHLKDGTTLQIFWCVRLLSTTNFPGSVKDNPRKYRITECVESTLKKSAVKYSFKSFNTFKTGKKLVQKVADNLKYVLSAPPFPAGTVHHFDVQLGREVQDALGRSQYFEADICSPIMAFDTLVTT